MVEFMLQGIRDRKSMTRWFYSFIFGMSLLCTLLTPAQGSVLTVRQASSTSTVGITLGVQCMMNGWFSAGDMCLGNFTVPQGWQFIVTEEGGCFTTTSKSEFPPVGSIFRGGDQIRIKVISTYTSMWLDSGLATCYLGFQGRLMSPDGMNSSLVGYSQKANSYTGVRLHYDSSGVTFSMNSLNVSMSRWSGGVKLNELTMDVADSIALRQGETARLFTVRNSTTGDGRVQVALSGDAAGSLTTYKNGSVANCNGRTFGAGGYCEIRVASNVPWFGERKARANVTVTIN